MLISVTVTPDYPLGVEDEELMDFQITSDGHYTTSSTYLPPYGGRLNMQRVTSNLDWAFSTVDTGTSHWIQVSYLCFLYL